MRCVMVINDSDCQCVYMRNAAAEYYFLTMVLGAVASCPLLSAPE